MKRNMKSLLALLLALCMAMSLLCASVWAAEGEVSAPDGSVSVTQAQDAGEAEAAPEESEEEAPAPGQEPEAEEEESAPEAEQEEAPAEEPELEAQADEPSDFYPVSATATLNGGSVSVKVKHGNLSFNLGSRTIIVEGKDLTNGGGWKECSTQLLTNARGYNGGTTINSDDGAWNTLKFVSGNQYQFRVCYTKQDGTRTAYATTEPITYHSAKQDQAALQEKINHYLTVGLDPNNPKEGENKVYTRNYDGLGLTANATAARYNRPLYQLDLTYTGTSTGDQGETLLNFRAECASRVPDNGASKDDSNYVEGLEFRMEGIYFINRKGEEQYQGLAGYDVTENFTVPLSELGFGCNYIRPKMICYGYNTYGVEQYWEDEPFCFAIKTSGAPLNQYSALTTKDTITLKPCTNYGGTLSYDSALPSYGGNVSESGVKVWYRKKGTSSWTEKKFKGTGIPKISGLKADTVYEWKAQSYLLSKDPKGESHPLTSKESSVFTVCTAVSSAPKVKSYKVSGAKVQRHHTETTWDSVGHKWIPAKTWYTTDFKVTYTFKNASKNIKGYTAGGVYAKVKSGKVTYSMSVNTGSKNAKAKKFSTQIQSCTNTNGPGYSVTGLSPKTKHSGKIK